MLLIAPVYLTYRTYQLFVGRLEDDQRGTWRRCGRLHAGHGQGAARRRRQAEHAEQAARGSRRARQPPEG